MNSTFSSDECRKMSIRTKMLLLLSVALFIFGFSAAAISYKIYIDSSLEEYKRFGTGIANLAAGTIDPDRVDEYLENGTVAEGYIETQRKLYKIREISPNIKYVYVYKIDEDGCHVVFDLDSEDTKAAEPGSIEEFDDEFTQYLPILFQGGNIDPIISDGIYGWLLSAYVPIYDSKGNCFIVKDIVKNPISTDEALKGYINGRSQKTVTRNYK